MTIDNGIRDLDDLAPRNRPKVRIGGNVYEVLVAEDLDPVVIDKISSLEVAEGDDVPPETQRAHTISQARAMLLDFPEDSEISYFQSLAVVSDFLERTQMMDGLPPAMQEVMDRLTAMAPDESATAI